MRGEGLSFYVQLKIIRLIISNIPIRLEELVASWNILYFLGNKNIFNISIFICYNDWVQAGGDWECRSWKGIGQQEEIYKQFQDHFILEWSIIYFLQINFLVISSFLKERPHYTTPTESFYFRVRAHHRGRLQGTGISELYTYIALNCIVSFIAL